VAIATHISLSSYWSNIVEQTEKARIGNAAGVDLDVEARRPVRQQAAPWVLRRVERK
jgi:hypothetical protein